MIRYRFLCSRLFSTGKAVAEDLGGTKELIEKLESYKRPVGLPYLPWVPTDQLIKRKTYFKRMAYLVQVPTVLSRVDPPPFRL